jgi:predicted dehydrogenase
MRVRPRIRFAVIGLNHPHIYEQVEVLREGGGELVSFFAEEAELAAEFSRKFAGVVRASVVREILEDETIQLVTSAAIPASRAALGIAVMQHGKDFMCAKPGFVTLDDLRTARRAQAETKRIFSVFYSERLNHPATVRAGELVAAGAIGSVIQTVGIGPHLSNPKARPDWFFEKDLAGGVIADIGSHQVDQFLFFTGSREAEIVGARVANYRHTSFSGFEDFGEVFLCGGQGASGYFRVDWLTPEGLGTWGDGRLFILGTEGYIEIRKNCNLPSANKGNHLFLVDQKTSRYVDCSDVYCPYGARLVADVLDRTETAMAQAHCFLTAELALTAQLAAERRLALQHAEGGPRPSAN